jgi:hypothetical protein
MRLAQRGTTPERLAHEAGDARRPRRVDAPAREARRTA